MYLVKKAIALTNEELENLGLIGVPTDWPVIVAPNQTPVPDGFSVMTIEEIAELKLTNQTQYDAWLASKMTAPQPQEPIHVDIITDLSVPKDTDGSPINKNKITKSGWSLQGRCISFKTANQSSLYNKTCQGVDIGDATLKFYDQNGVETTNMNDCCITVMDFEPTHNSDVIGGSIFIKVPPINPAYMFVMAVPDVPRVLGGSIPLLHGGMDLSFFGENSKFILDGRGAKPMVYDPVYHTSKIRCVLRHAASEQIAIMIIFDRFAA